LCSEILSLLDGFDDVLVQPFVPDGAVVSLDISVLLRLTWLDVLDGNPLFLGPYQQLATDVFGAVVDPYGAGFAAPFYDAVKAPDRKRRLRPIDFTVAFSGFGGGICTGELVGESRTSSL